MCIYCDWSVAGKPDHYFLKFVCFDCRVVGGVQTCNYKMNEWKTCYNCNKHMVNVGMKFKPPKKRDIKNWKRLKVEWGECKYYVPYKKVPNMSQNEQILEKFNNYYKISL